MVNVIMGSSEVDKSGEENEPKTPSSSSAPVTSQVCICCQLMDPAKSVC